jgi:hypothetical protein
MGMRNKRLYNVITFGTTANAMAMEKFCETNGIPGRLIPVPSAISAGCGLAWRILPEDFGELKPYIKGKNVIEIERIVSLEL